MTDDTMPESVDVIVKQTTAARAAITNGWALAKALTTAGRAVSITVREADDIGTRQRNYLHGYVLRTIAEQVAVNGQKYPLAVWKEHFRERFLGSKWRSFVVPGQFLKKRRKIRISTEDLGVKAYAAYTEQIMAHAAADLGIVWEHLSRDDWESRS